MQIRIADAESDNPLARSSVELARDPLEQLEQLRSEHIRLLRIQHKRLEALHRTLAHCIRSLALHNHENGGNRRLLS